MIDVPLDDNAGAKGVKPNFRCASDQFIAGVEPLSFTVGDFWAWAASDLMSNTMRGLVAEFIVANALKCTGDCRQEWNPFDLRTPDGVKVEVKSAAHRQAWTQKKLSPIRFSIAQTRGWNTETGSFDKTICRQGEVYVFCVLENVTPTVSDPLDVSRWSFFILAAAVLNVNCLKQRTITLSRIIQLGAVKCSYGEIREKVLSSRGLASTTPTIRNQAP